jgi:hypothetical protein
MNEGIFNIVSEVLQSQDKFLLLLEIKGKCKINFRGNILEEMKIKDSLEKF